MKKFLALLLVFVMVAGMLPVTALATEATDDLSGDDQTLVPDDDVASGPIGDDLIWTLEAGVLTISGTGPMYDFDVDNDQVPPWAEEYLLTIHTVIIQDGVTSIGMSSFISCENLVSVTIPNSVTTIGAAAFYGCTALNEITIPDSVTTIGVGAFLCCSSLTTVTIPASVTAIGEDAFYECTGLSEVIFVGDAPDLEEGAFEGVTATCYYPASSSTWNRDSKQDYGGSLTWVPYGVASGPIGDDLIWMLEDGVLTISGTGPMFDIDAEEVGPPWLEYVETIHTVILQEGVTTIGAYSFILCENLANVTIPASVTAIGAGAFMGCAALEEITIPDSVTIIDAAAFYGCESLTEMIIPDDVTAIADSTFYECTALAEVTIPAGVTTIGEEAFRGTALTEVTIPTGVTAIAQGTFCRCTSLAKVTIPTGVTSIGGHAFQNCSALEEVIFEGDAPAFETTVFMDTAATCYYPADNNTWNDDTMLDYGGTLNWVAYTVKSGPVITQQPANAEAKLGERFCVEVKAVGEDLTYQWYWRKVGSQNWKISSQCDNTYDDLMTSARHNREVYCVISDALGNEVKSEPATITGIPTVTLAITRQPDSQTVVLGEMFNVTFDAQGDGLQYQWYFRPVGTEKWRTSAQKDNSYDDVMTKARHNRELYCVVTDAWGNEVATDPIVTIMASVKNELAITKQPNNASAKLGEQFCVTVEAQGDGMQYQWYWRDVGSENWKISRQRNNTYDDMMTAARHNREVKCVITDMWGNCVESQIATITGISEVVLEITSQPEDDSAAMGEKFCVTVEAKGDNLSYIWYFKNEGAEKWCKSGVTDNTYDDVMTKARAGREVYCIVTDALGNRIATDHATIHITK